MPFFRGSRHVLLGELKPIRYLLRDEFTTADDNPLTSPRTCEPGPGTFAFRDVEGKLTIASGWLEFAAQATPVYAEEDAVSPLVITRAAGMTLINKFRCSTDGSFYPLALVTSATPTWNATHVEAAFHRAATALSLTATSGAAAGPIIATFVADSTVYNLALVLAATGQKYYIKGGAFTNWTLLWRSTTGDTAILYAAMAGYNAAFGASFIRDPQAVISISDILFSFTGAMTWPTTNVAPVLTMLDAGTWAADGTYVTNTPVGGNDSYTKLLLHLDGITTAIFDISPLKKAVSAINGATQSTTQSKFGGKSCYLPPGTAYIVSADHADWDLGTGPFTMDSWIYVTDPNNVGRIISRGDVTAGDADWTWGVGHHVGWGTGIRFNFAYRTGGAIVDLASNELTFNANTWYHVAIVRSGTGAGQFTFYLDGVAVGTATLGLDLTNSSALYIGIRKSGVGVGEGLIGYMDEVRFSKGIARWTANFTPPVGPYSQTWFANLQLATTDVLAEMVIHAYTLGTQVGWVQSDRSFAAKAAATAAAGQAVISLKEVTGIGGVGLAATDGLTVNGVSYTLTVTGAGTVAYDDVAKTQTVVLGANLGAEVLADTKVGLDWASWNGTLTYFDGAGNIKLDEILAGVYTNRLSAAVAFSADKRFIVRRIGAEYRVFYNEALVGTTSLVAAGAMVGKYWGLFSTLPANQITSAVVYDTGNVTNAHTVLDRYSRD